MKRLICLFILLLTLALLVSCGDGSKSECTHPNVELVYEREPNCDQNGSASKVCNSCGFVLETNVTVEMLEHDPVTLAGTDPTCISDGKTESTICRECQTVISPAEIIPASGHNYDNDVCTGCGNNKYGVLQFTATEDGSGYVVSIGNYTGNKIVIPAEHEGKPVVEIAERGFYDRDNIESVVIPDGVSVIGAAAFGNCGALTSVEINSTYVTLGEGAFNTCKSLLDVSFAEGCQVVEIPNYCFQNCDALTSIDLPTTVTRLGRYCFSWTGLTEIELHDGLTYIDEYAFASAKLVEINIPKSVEGIGAYAFQYNKVKSAVLPFVGASRNGTPLYETGYQTHTERFSYIGFTTVDRIEITDQEVIPAYAFDGTRIVTLTLHDGVREIGDYAFSNCTDLMHVSLPLTLTSIASSAFYNCTKLIEVKNGSNLEITAGSDSHGRVAKYAIRVYTDGGSAVTTDDRGFVFYELGGVFILLDYVGTEKEITTPRLDGYGYTYTIYQGAFYGSGITSVVISNQVTEIGNRAFANCQSLTSVTFEEDYLLTEIGEFAFYGCTSLAEITIPSRVTEIKEGTFNGCTALTTVGIPSSVVRIDNPFEGCTALSVDLPARLEHLYLRDFKKIINAELVSGIYYIDGWAVGMDGSTATTVVNIKDGTVGIAYHTFWDNGSSVVEITVPTSVRYISEGAFSGCYSELLRLTIPFVGRSIDEAEEYAMNKVGIPSTVKHVNITYGDNIPANSFRDFSNLETVVICHSVRSIGDYAFSGCSSLREVTFEGNSALTTLGISCFQNCTSLGSVNIPAGVTEVPESCFYNCDSIDGLVIGEGITSIGKTAFANCDNLKFIVLPKSVTAIGQLAFYYCPALTSVSYRGSEAEWAALGFTYVYEGDFDVKYDYVD